MGVSLVTDAQVVGLICLGLVSTVAAGLAWNGRRRSPVGQVEPPGSGGEHTLQRRYGSQDRASRFYRQQLPDRLNEQMVAFIGRQEMVWIATADGHGECDCSFRAGPPGFVQVLDAWTLRYPEYRGNTCGRCVLLAALRRCF